MSVRQPVFRIMVFQPFKLSNLSYTFFVKESCDERYNRQKTKMFL